MPGKQVTELDALPSFTDTSLLPVHNGAGLKKGLLSQLANYLGTKFSNPNLLINPKFEINQRGSTTYTTGYTVDRWRVAGATLNAKTKTLSNPNSAGGTFLQSLENKPTGTFTVTLNVASVTGTVKFSWKDGTTYRRGATITKGINTYTFSASSLTCVGIEVYAGASVQLDYMKLENGSVATQYVNPIYNEEYLKCMWFFQPLTGARSGYFSNERIYINIPEVNSMRISKPSVDSSNITLEGWIYTGANANAINVGRSDITNVSIDNYKELVLTPSSALLTKLNQRGVSTISYVINVGGGIYLDAEIYGNEQEK